MGRVIWLSPIAGPVANGVFLAATSREGLLLTNL